jgi:hypothetical protein
MPGSRSLLHNRNEAVTIYLLPVGTGRFELYSEPRDEEPAISPQDGFFKRQFHHLGEQWRSAVQAARQGDAAAGRFRQWRDWSVCRIAEMIAEQRTLWAIRNEASVRFLYPSDLSEAAAGERRRSMLSAAKRHHGVWAIVDGLLFLGSALLALIPGPNVVAYYFGLRFVGHCLSWRGARHGLDRLQWVAQAEPALAELGALADVPRAARAPRVAAIADALHLPRLAAFFDRTAVGSQW